MGGVNCATLEERALYVQRIIRAEKNRNVYTELTAKASVSV